jgi:hypothetical protein
MRKVSTPGDRAYLVDSIPVVMTKLEILMPIDWNTTVIHIFTHHTVDIIKALGPFNAANILDIERFHTLFKSLARGRENVMASIKNHYLLLEVALSARMNEDLDWTTLPAKSTPAGYAGRLDSATRMTGCANLSVRQQVPLCCQTSSNKSKHCGRTVPPSTLICTNGITHG